VAAEEIEVTDVERAVAYAEIANLRRARWRQTDDLKVKTQAEAVRFIDEVGVALLFPGDGIALPDLWSAINGRLRELPKRHHDWALHKTWDWKDRIPSKRKAWYGKLVRGKPAFVSMRDLPAVYALSSNFGEIDDYLEAYQDGLLSREGKEVYEALLERGPLPTSELRKVTGMAGGGDNARRFERAVVELQQDFKIVKAGISDANRWKYCYVYDVLLHWAPDLAEKSRAYTSRTATRHLVGRYLDSAVAAPPASFAKMFGWEPAVTQRYVEEMLADGTLSTVRVMGAPPATPKGKTPPEGEVWVTKGP
jgi:hypothetical protein